MTPQMPLKHPALLLCCFLLLPAVAKARAYYVSPSGSDSGAGTLADPFRTIQHGLDVATAPGDVVYVRAGTYAEALRFPADGATGSPITLRNYPGERPAISGRGLKAQKLVEVFNRSHVVFSGFTVGDLIARTTFQSGAIFVEGSGDDIVISGNDVHDIAPPRKYYANGRAINVRGFYATRPLTHVQITNNSIERCIVTDGNVLEVSGNSQFARVLDNNLRDNAGAALNITGGTHPPYYTPWPIVVSDVLVRGNTVERTGSNMAIGLYVQASHRVTVLDNDVKTSMIGVYVASEYRQVEAQDVTVSGNVITGNRDFGLWIGTPYHHTAVRNVRVTGNDVEQNGADHNGNFGIGRAIGVQVTGNIFVSGNNLLLTSLGSPYQSVLLNKNCYDDPDHVATDAVFQYGSHTYTGFSDYQRATGQDTESSFGARCNGAFSRRW